MDYLGYKLWSGGILLVVVFIWQFWRGLNGLPAELEQPDTGTAQDQARPRDDS